MKKIDTSDVDLSKIPEKYRGLIKDEMTPQEISMFGLLLMRDKLDSMKKKFRFWRRHKNEQD